MPDSIPKDLDLGEVTTTAGAAAGEAKPTAEPPALTTGDGGVTAWVNNQKVNALWSINQTRNSWIGIAGVGWKKLANNSDTAVVALSILGASAKQAQGPVNFREEADKMVHEMYVW
jgi:hypothetical protein